MPGAVFSMVLIKMQEGCESAPPLPGVERFIFLVEGEIEGDCKYGGNYKMFELTPGKDEYAFFPHSRINHDDETVAGDWGSRGYHNFRAKKDSVILMYEQVYRPPHPGLDNVRSTEPVFGNVDAAPMLDPGAPEVFGLRKLLPLSNEYDFNIHVMDFEPGQYLHCNEMHYNQHGMLMLEGQGVYRLRDDKWYHVRAGDAIYMAPFVPQWYAALEPGRTRYILYKDTYRDPLQSGGGGIVHDSKPGK